MNIGHRLTLPCTITHVEDDGDPDAYGNPTETTTTTESTCWLHQTYRDDSEATTARTNHGTTNVSTERFTAYFLPTVDLDRNDRVTVDGTEYQVVGPPWRAFNPRTRRYEHIEATLEVAG